MPCTLNVLVLRHAGCWAKQEAAASPKDPTKKKKEELQAAREATISLAQGPLPQKDCYKTPPKDIPDSNVCKHPHTGA
jgi:hypothetical protein